MSILDDTGIALSTTIIILGLALGLPNIELGIFGIDFSQFSSTVITVIRLGLVGLAISIGLKPLEDKTDTGGYR